MENHQKNSADNLIIPDYVSRLYRFPGDSGISQMRHWISTIP